ncbi:MFS general substrate transporter [Aaosphaeria arxii CBS 175.79]|uniref:MFS general substrate transporter n=1 Tax=Aaosphaeria arxii CBS 175.79 TaxID=1450172 RepID=A0A6A5Y7W1_9PLEO|nr:MFS general substrate transporter [Aaosphaeria arxii CBS 175.79]KAF2021323.1 MFS general substrate transporter [Aaosphaeria arxii CBS 175.79]
MLLHLLVGMFSGRALDAGFFKWVLIPGVICTTVGLMLTSISTQYYQLFLAQGLLFGIGCGLQFTPCVSVVYTYFSSRKALACAVVASGGATGGLIFPTIARQLLPKLGFAWTMRINAFVGLAVGCCYCVFLKPRIPPRKSGPLLELRAFKEAPYTLYVLGVFLTSFGQLWAFYYIGPYAIDVLGASYSESINLLMVLNGVGLAGRIIPSYFADTVLGGLNTMIPAILASSVIMFCWPAVNSMAGLYVYAVVQGFVAASFQGLFPSTLGTLTTDMTKIGVRTGQGFSVIAFANLLGPPIAGALVQRSGGKYLSAQMWSASMILLGGLVLLAARIKLTGLKLRAKV